MGIPGIVILVLLGGGLAVMILGWLWIAITSSFGTGHGGNKAETRHRGGRRRRNRYLRKFLARVL